MCVYVVLCAYVCLCANVFVYVMWSFPAEVLKEEGWYGKDDMDESERYKGVCVSYPHHDIAHIMTPWVGGGGAHSLTSPQMTCPRETIG